MIEWIGVGSEYDIRRTIGFDISKLLMRFAPWVEN